MWSSCDIILGDSPVLWSWLRTFKNNLSYECTGQDKTRQVKIKQDRKRHTFELLWSSFDIILGVKSCPMVVHSGIQKRPILWVFRTWHDTARQDKTYLWVVVVFLWHNTQWQSCPMVMNSGIQKRPILWVFRTRVTRHDTRQDKTGKHRTRPDKTKHTFELLWSSFDIILGDKSCPMIVHSGIQKRPISWVYRTRHDTTRLDKTYLWVAVVFLWHNTRWQVPSYDCAFGHLSYLVCGSTTPSH